MEKKTTRPNDRKAGNRPGGDFRPPRGGHGGGGRPPYRSDERGEGGGGDRHRGGGGNFRGGGGGGDRWSSRPPRFGHGGGGGGRPPYRSDERGEGGGGRPPYRSDERGEGGGGDRHRGGGGNFRGGGGGGGDRWSSRPPRFGHGGGGGGRPPYRSDERGEGGGRPPYRSDERGEGGGDRYRGGGGNFRGGGGGGGGDRWSSRPPRFGYGGGGGGGRPPRFGHGGGGGGRPPYRSDERGEGGGDRPRSYESARGDFRGGGGGRPPRFGHGGGGGRPPYRSDERGEGGGGRPRFGHGGGGGRPPYRSNERGNGGGNGGHRGYESDRDNFRGGGFRPSRPGYDKARPPRHARGDEDFQQNAPNNDNNGSEKVQKILARCGLGSRRDMESLLSEGRVQINGDTIALGARATADDELRVDGEVVEVLDIPSRLLLYNKPKGKWVTRDADVDNVFTDLPSLNSGRWLNVGRLDVNTEGLLLFSTDGELTHRLTHPSNGQEREYRARVDGTLPDEAMEDIRQDGIVLDGGERVVPSLFEVEESGDGVNTWYRIIVCEGRNRVVRRIFEHYDMQVSRLLRVRFGDYQLPGDLVPGAWREMPLDAAVGDTAPDLDAAAGDTAPNDLDVVADDDVPNWDAAGDDTAPDDLDAGDDATPN